MWWDWNKVIAMRRQLAGKRERECDEGTFLYVNTISHTVPRHARGRFRRNATDTKRFDAMAEAFRTVASSSVSSDVHGKPSHTFHRHRQRLLNRPNVARLLLLPSCVLCGMHYEPVGATKSESGRPTTEMGQMI